MSKNVQTNIQLHSLHILVRLCSKSFKLGFSNMWAKNFQAQFQRGRGARDQTANISWIMEKAKEFQKNLNFCLIDYAKAFDCDYNQLWKILKVMGVPDHLTYLLIKLYAGQEATVRTGHGTTNWLQIGKGVWQGYMLSSCLFNFYAEYTMWNAGLDKPQAGIKIARTEISTTSVMQIIPH